MPESVFSPFGVLVRLTDERWQHIVDNHRELWDLRHHVQGAVEHPEKVVGGQAGELLAAQEHGPGMWLVVVYRESGGDGFIITAFLTSRTQTLEKRQKLWP